MNKLERLPGSETDLHPYGARVLSTRSHADDMVFWYKNGPLNAAFIAVILNAQIADP